MRVPVRFSALILLPLLAACAEMAPPAKVAEAPPPAPVAIDRDLPKPPADASVLGLYLAGKTAANDGRSDIAADYLAAAAAELDPGSAGFLKDQAFTEAVKAGRIEQAAVLAPQDGEGAQTNVRLGRLVVAVDELASGRAQEAYDGLSGDALGPPFRTAGALLRPWAAAAAGNMDLAVQPLEPRGEAIVQAFAQQDRALLLEKAGKTADAEAVFKGLMGQDTRIGIFAMSYGGFLERQGRRAEAAAVYDALLADRPDDVAARAARDRVKGRKPAPPAPTPREGAAEALWALASTSIAQNQQSYALAYVQLALRLDPRQPESLLMVGDFFEGQGDSERARAAFSAIPKGSLEYLPARSRLTLNYLAANENDKAVQVAQETARDLPEDENAQLLLADTLREAKDFAGALPVLNKVITARGKDASWQLYYSRAVLLEKTGQWPLAEKDLKSALTIAPNQAELQNYLGYSWADRNEHLPEALDLLKKAHQSQPNSGAILDSLGWAYFRMGDYANAVKYLEQAVVQDPAAADINDHLGDAYLKSGRRLEARYQWERVLTLDAEPQLRAAASAKIAANPEEPAQAVAAADPAQGARTP